MRFAVTDHAPDNRLPTPAPAPVPRADARAPLVVGLALAGVVGLAWLAGRDAARRSSARAHRVPRPVTIGAPERAGGGSRAVVLAGTGLAGLLVARRAGLGRALRLPLAVRLALAWLEKARPLWPGGDGRAGPGRNVRGGGAGRMALLGAGVLLGAGGAAPLGWARTGARGGRRNGSDDARPAAAGDVAAARRRIAAGALLLDVAVLADSGLEHYRACFCNPAMYLPLAASGLGILANAGGLTGSARGRVLRAGVHLTGVTVGLTGLGFHLYNIGKRPGGVDWLNLFYGAPFGAPGALVLAGLIGWASERLGADAPAGGQRLLGLPAGRAMAALAGFGLLGTVSEVALLHFRGAYHNPFMWLPVTLPPLSAAMLAKAALLPPADDPWATRGTLWATALVGVIGVGFHAYGVHRNMGGWRNWSQNILAGPPLPAPPSFLALAVAGLGATRLIGDAG